jgi:hypothetical protein
MTAPMIETFLALLTAHLTADFVLQTEWMVARKRNPGVLTLHGLVVFAATAAALGGALPLALGLALAHVAIDTVKVHLAPLRLSTFLADQAAHLATLAVAAALMPGALAAGAWGAWPPPAMQGAVVLCGFIVATLAGGPAVGLLMARFKASAAPGGLENAGRIIGLLERALIFLMVMIDEPTAIGFLIAAKSILRFDTVSRDQQISEYVIIGTLASFGWALVAAFGTTAALDALAPFR